MKKILLVGKDLGSYNCSSALNKNQKIEFTKNSKESNIALHTDYGIIKNPIDKSKKNFGWFLESSAIIEFVIKTVVNNLPFYKSRFEYIFTHDQRIINIDPMFFKFALPSSRPWIQNRKIYNKTKKISMISSKKTQTDGHRYRQEIMNKYFDKIDHFGKGHYGRELPQFINFGNMLETGKLLGLKDYAYSITIQNSYYDDHFCEKIADCFATGTIPIFWGTKRISNYFNNQGIVFLEDMKNIDVFTLEYYHSKIDFIKENFDICMSMPTAEDYIYDKYLISY